MHLGAGRVTKDDQIDYSAGIVLNKKINDYVQKGEVLMTVHTNKEVTSIDFNAFQIAPKPIEEPKIILDIVK